MIDSWGFPWHHEVHGKNWSSSERFAEHLWISQNKLAIAMGVRSSVVYRWFHESIDPTVNTLVKMVVALKLLDIDAAREFVQRYLGEIFEDDGEGEVNRSTNTE